MDNAFIERLSRSVKYEEVYLNAYDNARDAKAGLVVDCFSFYNSKCHHQSLDRATPRSGVLPATAATADA